MKISKLNLGQPLTKDQQKQIKGGSGVCAAGDKFRCTCSGGSFNGTACISGNGVSDANQLCTSFCLTTGGNGTHVGACHDAACYGDI
jgi:hypothetical protein